MTERHPPPPEDFAELYEEAPCGYISVGTESELIRVNRTLLTWTGYGEAELRDRNPLTLLLTVPSALLFQTNIAPLLRLRGFVSEIALDLRCKSGSLLPVLCSANVKRDAAGAPLLFRLVFSSAPTRRDFERELRRARAQAEDAAEELRRLGQLAQRKVDEQAVLLEAVARMTHGDLTSPVRVDPESSLAPLAVALDRMRQDILDRLRELKEHHAEVRHLNLELRRQIEQRSRLLIESLTSGIAAGREAGTEHAAPETQPILARGTLLAERYRIVKLLGQGGMGTVYEVERTSDGRRYAAKVLGVKPTVRAMARFAREAQLLARIHHPNLIDILDVDITEDRVAYIIMELVRGKSLAELGGRYGERGFMLWVLKQMAEALAAVHAAGAVHRDVKPGNILIALHEDAPPRVKLADFGISRLLDTGPDTPHTSPPAIASLPAQLPDPDGARDGFGKAATVLRPPRRTEPELPEELFSDGMAAETANPVEAPQDAADRRHGGMPGGRGRAEELTQAGAILGTPHYMAPELARGAQLARPSADMFSFGMVAYEVLTGTLPFDKPPILWAQVGAQEPAIVPLSKRCPGLSPAVAETLEACLAIEPLRRPSASEVAHALTLSLGALPPHPPAHKAHPPD